MKTCTKCGVEQKHAAFCKDKSRRDGLCPWCRSCQRVYRQANKVERAAKREVYKAAHKVEIAAQKAVYKRANPELMNAQTARRRAAKLAATSDSYDADVEVHLRALLATLQEETGEALHLDHWIPLSEGGLHEPGNWTLLTDSENCSKHAKVPGRPTPTIEEAIARIKQTAHERTSLANYLGLE